MNETRAITHPIIYTASRLEAIANRYVFGPMGTTASGMKILGLLLKHGSLTPQRIRELSGGTKSNVSQRLGYLEKKGYIVRDEAVFPNDLRKILVKLTAKGKTQMTEVHKRMKSAQLCLASHFTEKEIEQHCKFIGKVNSIIDKEERNLNSIFNV
jgi:DNA-binding MarR family transcriptional regulator